FTIEFFSSSGCNASGNGEGAVFLGPKSVTTDALGNVAAFNFAVAGLVAGEKKTNNATGASHTTTEVLGGADAKRRRGTLPLSLRASPWRRQGQVASLAAAEEFSIVRGGGESRGAAGLRWPGRECSNNCGKIPRTLGS